MALILRLAPQLCEWEERDDRKCDPVEPSVVAVDSDSTLKGQKKKKKGISAPQSH